MLETQNLLHNSINLNSINDYINLKVDNIIDKERGRKEASKKRERTK